MQPVPPEDIIPAGKYWNRKIYGNEKYGYRIYLDSKETRLSTEQVARLQEYLKEDNRMTASEFEQIKNKIAKEQENAMKAEGALDRIQQQLKQDFNIETDEQIEERMNELENKLNELNKKLDELTKKLESSIDWDSV